MNKRASTWRAGIHDADVALRFARLLNGFEHIEASMGALLAKVLKVRNFAVTQAIYVKALRSPNMRIEVMRAAIDYSSCGAKEKKKFNRVVDSYDKNRQGRNSIAHGLWWTDLEGATFLAKQSSMTLAIIRAKPFGVREFDGLLSEQDALRDEVLRLLFPGRREI